MYIPLSHKIDTPCSAPLLDQQSVDANKACCFSTSRAESLCKLLSGNVAEVRNDVQSWKCSAANNLYQSNCLLNWWLLKQSSQITTVSSFINLLFGDSRMFPGITHAPCTMLISVYNTYNGGRLVPLCFMSSHGFAIPVDTCILT